MGALGVGGVAFCIFDCLNVRGTRALRPGQYTPNVILGRAPQANINGFEAPYS
jgi:hypothetical protein